MVKCVVCKKEICFVKRGTVFIKPNINLCGKRCFNKYCKVNGEPIEYSTVISCKKYRGV